MNPGAPTRDMTQRPCAEASVHESLLYSHHNLWLKGCKRNPCK